MGTRQSLTLDGETETDKELIQGLDSQQVENPGFKLSQSPETILSTNLLDYCKKKIFFTFFPAEIYIILCVDSRIKDCFFFF